MQSFNESIKLVVFELSTEEFGIEITKINSIIRLQKITKIPYAANFIEGIINYRGHPLVVIDLRKRFNLPTKQGHDENMRIIVLDFHPFLVGMIVDNVSEVLSLPYTFIEPVPDNLISIDIEQEYLLGVGNLDKGERLIILLDLGKIFSDHELEELGIMFSQEKQIRYYLERSLEEREKTEEKMRRSAAEASQLRLLDQSEEKSFTTTGTVTADYIDKEREKIRQIALREFQQEMGISVVDEGSEGTEVIYLEDGQEIEEEEGVEYVYVDEDGHEIPPEELSGPETSEPLEESISDMSTEEEDVVFDDDVAELIAAAEDETEFEETAESVPLDNAKVDAYKKYLNSMTKKDLLSFAENFPGISVESKMKKGDLVTTLLEFIEENSPNAILNYS